VWATTCSPSRQQQLQRPADAAAPSSSSSCLLQLIVQCPWEQQLQKLLLLWRPPDASTGRGLSSQQQEDHQPCRENVHCTGS
jgi:hypothetical protein